MIIIAYVIKTIESKDDVIEYKGSNSTIENPKQKFEPKY